jgi:hypothetical protein
MYMAMQTSYTKKGRKRRGNEVNVPEDTLTLEITCSETGKYYVRCFPSQMRISRTGGED